MWWTGSFVTRHTEISGLNEEVRSIDETVVKLQTVFDLATRRRATDQESWSNAEEGLIEARLAVAGCPGSGRGGDRGAGGSFRPGGPAIDRERTGGEREL